MKIVIIDDEPAMANYLCQQISLCCAKRDWVHDCYVFTSSEDLLHMDLSEINVAFLDIDMPKINGLQIAKELRKRYPEMIIIFVTSWIKYAPEGYEVNALIYLMKDRLPRELDSCLDAIQERLFENQETLKFQSRDGIIEVSLKNIIYIEGTSWRYVLLHLNNPLNSKEIECVGKLETYELRLQENGFLRLQKSFLVNMHYIARITNYYAYLQDGQKIKVSEKKYKEICKRYLSWKGNYL